MYSRQLFCPTKLKGSNSLLKKSPWKNQAVNTALGRDRILVQVTIYRRLRIGRDGHLDQSEAYDISWR